MSVSDLAIVAALVFGWGTLSARLERFDVTAPITFVLAGLLLTHGPLAVLGAAPSNELIMELAEFTLALVLFSDASRVGLHELRTDAALYLRLLGAALPLTIGLGTLLAFALASNASIWLALLVGAVLGLAVCAYASGVALHGNAFIAAFAGGPRSARQGADAASPWCLSSRKRGALVSLLVWLAFGAVAVAPAAEDLTWQIALYAVLSLTVIRIVPVAIALAGARLGQATILLVGWFGPRGLAGTGRIHPREGEEPAGYRDQD